MLFWVIWGPPGLVFGALGRVWAALLVLLKPLGGSLDFQEFLQTLIRAIQWIKPGFLKNLHFPVVKLQFLKVRVAIQISDTFSERPPYTVIYDGLWHFARVRLRNRFILLMSTLLSAYYLILFFQIVVFPYFGPPRCRFWAPQRTPPPSETE